MKTKSKLPKISDRLRGRQVPHIGVLAREDVDEIMTLGEWFRDNPTDRTHCDLLRGRLQVLLFVYESTRTRLGFEAAMAQLGGSTTYLNVKDTQMGRGESIKDTARALDQYMDTFAGRLWSQDDMTPSPRTPPSRSSTPARRWTTPRTSSANSCASSRPRASSKA